VNPETRISAVLGLALAVLAASAPVASQGFAISVTPPRFELAVKPGERTRQVIELSNAFVQPTTLRVKTADWKFNADDTVVFEDALAPGSCRPWVAIERRELVVPGGGAFRYRFEIAPPADAAPVECRFAIVLEGDEQSVATSGAATVGVVARIGVIVYATVGDVAPKLDVVDAKLLIRNGAAVPVISVRNTGNAHGRVTGFLSGRDGNGRDLEFDLSTLPILPGETRSLEMVARQEGNETVKVAFPVTIKGKLEWGDQSTPFEHRFAE
jgi:hypothetical protein